MLSDERIAELRDDASKIAPLHRTAARPFARAIEAEIRKQDEALIRQMLEGLEATQRMLERDHGEGLGPTGRSAVAAARLRLEGKP